LRSKASPYAIDLREIPDTGLQRSFDLSGDFARAALVDTDAKPDTARLKAKVELQKSGEEVLARGAVDGSVTMVCSRCVGPAEVSLSAPFEVLFLPRDADVAAPGDDEGEDVGDQPDIIPYEDGQLDLEETLREELLLALPYAPLCKESCKGLCPTCGKDLNDGPCKCPDAPDDDERFAALKHLKV
jgi:uncharacterized protein